MSSSFVCLWPPVATTPTTTLRRLCFLPICRRGLQRRVRRHNARPMTLQGSDDEIRKNGKDISAGHGTKKGVGEDVLQRWCRPHAAQQSCRSSEMVFVVVTYPPQTLPRKDDECATSEHDQGKDIPKAKVTLLLSF